MMSAKQSASARRYFCLCLVWTGFISTAYAASEAGSQWSPIQTPRDVYAIPLRKPEGPPPNPHASPTGSQEQWAQAGELRFVRNVTQATITPVLPDAGKGSGAAVIIAPGGAWQMLSIDNEGYRVARWLADHGVAGIVLKYRTEPTPTNDAAFQTALKQRLGQFKGKTTAAMPGEALAVEDALDALRIARARAKEMAVDPERIGMLGFSAGAIAALQAALGKDTSVRPLFVASIYGPMQARAVPKDAPPLFIAHAQDDKLFRAGDLALANAWRKAGSPVELHLYERGGHGFGAAPQGSSSDHWLDEFYWWLSARGVLQPSKQ